MIYSALIMNPCFPAVYFADPLFDHEIHIYFSYFFHINLIFPCESQKINKHEKLLNGNAPLEIIFSSSVVCIEVTQIINSIQFSAKTI